MLDYSGFYLAACEELRALHEQLLAKNWHGAKNHLFQAQIELKLLRHVITELEHIESQQRMK